MNEPRPIADIPSHVQASRVVDFDVYNEPGLSNDFHDTWLKLRDENTPGLVWTTRNGGHWLPTRGEDIARLYMDHQNFSSRVMQVPRERMAGNRPIPGSYDPPVQNEYRAIINPPLLPRVIQTLEPTITGLAKSLVDGFKARGECDYVSDFALQLPIRVFLSYAGLPESDAPHLRHLAEEKVRPTGKMDVAEVMQALRDYLTPRIEARRAAPGDDLLSQLVNGKMKDRPLEVDEAVRMCSQVIVAGLDTVASALSFIMLWLSKHPEVRHELAASPEKIPAAVEEFLRMFPLVAIAREVENDFELDGQVMKKGDIVVLSTMLHGLDESIFDHPMDFDLTRRRQVNSTFGQGTHRCPGASLARTELQIALREWLSAIPDFEVKPGSDIVFTGGVVATVRQLPLIWQTP